jgi:hypothetical protein
MKIEIKAKDLERITRVLPYLAFGLLLVVVTIGISVRLFESFFPHLLDGGNIYNKSSTSDLAVDGAPNSSRNFFEFFSFLGGSISGLALPLISLFAIFFTVRQIQTAVNASAFDAYYRTLAKWERTAIIDARNFYLDLHDGWRRGGQIGSFSDDVHQRLRETRANDSTKYRGMFIELAGLLEEIGFLCEEDANFRNYMLENIGSDLKFMTSAVLEHVKWRRGAVEQSQTTYCHLIYLYKVTQELDIKFIDGFMRDT